MSNVTVDVEWYDSVWYDFMSADGEGGIMFTKKVIRVWNKAKQLCPVDTGRLRNSIAWEIEGAGDNLEARVGSNVYYAAFVELGTRYMAPRAFLRNALASVVGEGA